MEMNTVWITGHSKHMVFWWVESYVPNYCNKKLDRTKKGYHKKKNVVIPTTMYQYSYDIFNTVYGYLQNTTCVCF